jgi:hypothetical protein
MAAGHDQQADRGDAPHDFHSTGLRCDLIGFAQWMKPKTGLEAGKKAANPNDPLPVWQIRMCRSHTASKQVGA